MSDHLVTDQLVKRLQQVCSEYGAKATELSNYIEQLEKLLASMPGKLECAVDRDGARLIFKRVDKGWRLLFTPKVSTEGARVLALSTVSDKIAATPLLQPLLEEMLKQHLTATAPLDVALAKAEVLLSSLGGK